MSGAPTCRRGTNRLAPAFGLALFLCLLGIGLLLGLPAAPSYAEAPAVHGGGPPFARAQGSAPRSIRRERREHRLVATLASERETSFGSWCALLISLCPPPNGATPDFAGLPEIVAPRRPQIGFFLPSFVEKIAFLLRP